MQTEASFSRAKPDAPDVMVYGVSQEVSPG